MFSYIKGKIEFKSENLVVLDVNGVGFELYVSANTLSEIGGVGEEAKIYTYMNVQEDLIKLYGFYSKEEKNMFLKLIGISSVGPKMANQILSGIKLSTLALAIVSGNVKELSKIKGVGKKTAERIILELREKLQADQIESSDDAIIEQVQFIKLGQVENEAISALCSLGISKGEATRAVESVASKADKLEDLITLALRSL